ncbi:MAG: threonine synthase [Acidimicrobiales bacterium]
MLGYESTRGSAPELGFADVLLAGLAPDGGLYVPTTWPTSTPMSADRPYGEFAAGVMWPFVEGTIEREDFEAIVDEAYRSFSDPAVIPISALADGTRLVELFWGPTLAFKDVAMQLLGRLFDHELERREARVTIVGATSGDTGSAAIEAFRDRQKVDIVILHPHERTSEVQRRQMTTVVADNVHNVAIDGTFDDCQDLVKAMFADDVFRSEVDLGAVNSINWARVMAQVVYYHWAAQRVGEGEPISVTVPTGNFGNVFAGRVAKRMGASIGEFVVASNRNAILTQFFGTGEMTIGEVEPSLSPSMDIQVSSNLERLLYELLGSDGRAVADFMAKFRRSGQVALPAEVVPRLQESWFGERVSDEQTLETMARVYEESGVVLDPHTAVGVAASARRPDFLHRAVMATAHPAKFPDAVEKATGIRPQLPPHLVDLLSRDERFTVLPNDLGTVQSYVRAVRR